MVTPTSSAALVAILLCAAPAGAQPPSPLRAVSLESPMTELDKLLIVQSWWHVADMVSTSYDLQLGGHEANPILAPFTHQTVALSVASGAADVLEALALRKLAVKHRTLATIGAGVMLAAKIWATTNNVRVAGELQRRRRP